VAALILSVNGLSKRFGGLLAVADVSLEIAEGGITGVIGPNGAGKTTLFAMIAGFVPPSTGTVAFRGTDITGDPAHLRARRGLARTFQIVQPFAGLSVRENIAVGAHLRHPSRRTALARAAAVAEKVGLAGELDKPAASLTIAGRKRLELARALATEPVLLLLDEVLAGLNPTEVAAMLPILRALPGEGVTVLMIEHVMQAVMQLCGTVHVLAGGKLITAGPPAAVVADPAVIEAYLGHGAAARAAAHA
jgi:branched-chain amino acid transport system ATP-binding protein